jgi:hypothetical protein
MRIKNFNDKDCMGVSASWGRVYKRNRQTAGSPMTLTEIISV